MKNTQQDIKETIRLLKKTIPYPENIISIYKAKDDWIIIARGEKGLEFCDVEYVWDGYSKAYHSRECLINYNRLDK